MFIMPVDSPTNKIIEQERKHPAEYIPQTPANQAPPAKEQRIAAHDLFTLFTATIILKNETFVR
jgi:hypothetical protein